jgi:alpha-galactosidase
MSRATKETLMNKEVIAIDQDPLGKQATQISVKGDIETWARPLEDGSVAVGIFNRGLATERVSVRASDLKLSGNVTARNLWSHKAVRPQDGTFFGSVPTHGVLLLRITPAK